jgi:predicted NUDIX family phosphoesterase
MSMGRSNRVLAVPAGRLADAGIGEGFTRAGSRKQFETICKYADRFVDRPECETDESVRQLIPYVVLRDKDHLIFTYRRPPDNTEGRLAGRRSLGVGGHVDEPDCNGRPGLAGVRYAMLRELKEEIACDFKSIKYSWVGFINETSSPVGRVHLGLVVVADVANGIVTPAEGCAETACHQLMDFGQLHKYIDEFESWSAMVIRGLFARPESIRGRFR